MAIKTLIQQYRGNITYDTLTLLDFSLTTDEVIDELKEDLMQVEFDNNTLLDIGWYPEFNAQGQFTIQVIKDYNWEVPLFKAHCKTLEDIENTLTKALPHCQ
ncbi:hypothetical protein AV926_15670 [Myroides marinus]|uniref:Uncharacterized protein n=1 Tax=Myroides marinus TaxID=703342 RepID=A0A163WN86_9FLAO|nr:hypothetical protein [Myroides marinus]KZE76580.1 hypothetical protein AV926_15670 [Myroides marinus]